MSTVWRFTGPPENWITAISLNKWALNEHNRSLWEKDIRPGDTVLFHSTKNSGFSEHATSSVIGFGYVGEGMVAKDMFWWVQEVADKQNYWPYVVPLKEVYLFSDVEGIDFSTPLDKKAPEVVRREIDLLTANALPVNELNKKAEETDPSSPQFPITGSASRVNKIFEELILDQNQDFFLSDDTQETEVVEARLAEGIDEKLSKLDKGSILEAAKAFDNRNAQSHTVVVGPRKIRKENQIQKRRIAALEDYTCQVCGFRCEYQKENGKKGWIIHIDHIKEKADSGAENLDNLWALCPNCHAKKTCGILKIDPVTRRVTEKAATVELVRDNHLFV